MKASGSTRMSQSAHVGTPVCKNDVAELFDLQHERLVQHFDTCIERIILGNVQTLLSLPKSQSTRPRTPRAPPDPRPPIAPLDLWLPSQGSAHCGQRGEAIQSAPLLTDKDISSQLEFPEVQLVQGTPYEEVAHTDKPDLKSQDSKVILESPKRLQSEASSTPVGWHSTLTQQTSAGSVGRSTQLRQEARGSRSSLTHAFKNDFGELFAEMESQVGGQSFKDLAQKLELNRKGSKLKRASAFLISPACFYVLIDTVVLSNIVMLGFQSGSSWKGWFKIDCIFAAIYLIEIYFKLRTTRCSVIYPGSHGFNEFALDVLLIFLALFDIAVTLTGLFDDQGTNVAWVRSARLARITRILKVIKLPMARDLMLMINAAVGGLRTLFWSITLITLPVYVFALFFTEMLGPQNTGKQDDVTQNFSSVSVSMLTGFRCLIVGDCSALNGTPIFPHLVREHGWFYGFIYVVTFVCMSFGLFNVIVAIYVENTVAAAKSNEMLQRQRRLEDHSRFAEKTLNLVHYLWTCIHRGKEHFVLESALHIEIGQQDFNRLVTSPEMLNLLGDLDVPKEDCKDLFDICDADASGVVTLAELVAGVKRLRGDPRRSDLVYVMLRMEKLMSDIKALTGEEEVSQPASILRPATRWCTPRLAEPLI